MSQLVPQVLRLPAALALVLRRWPYARRHAPYLNAGCLVAVLAGMLTLVAICSLAAMLFVVLLFLKGVIP